MEHLVVELTAVNRCGVLERIIGVYARHKYNIDTLTVRETPDPALSSVRIAACGEPMVLRQMTRQLNKLFDVKDVTVLKDQNLLNTKEK